jgi:hypothetical protein
MALGVLGFRTTMGLSHIAALRLLTRSAAALTACSLIACSSSNQVASPRVMLVQDDEFVLTGTIDERPPTDGACVAGAPKHMLKLVEPLKTRITLRATSGAAPLTGAVLTLTNVDSKKTICAAMKTDGAPAILAAEVPVGTYAIGVAGEVTRRYEIYWEQR